MYLKITLCFLLFLLQASCTELRAYSILTHQAMIDAAWEKELVPVLEKRFPGATLQELKDAHAYAYGGAIMPDMGYYPFGSRFFTDLVHYVRTGDFTQNLISEATNRNELAFALGALAHYHGDIQGHKLGTNRSVPLIYPETRKYFGEVVTYEEDPVAHMRMEFGFDVLQAARGNYAPQAYRDFIGFKVAGEVLERAFYKTYGLKLKQTFVYVPLAAFVFKIAVKAVLPQVTKIGWEWVDKDAMKNEGSAADQEVAHLLRKSSFNELFSRKNDEPGISARILAAVFRFVPKIGILEPLHFEIPTPEAESLFAISFATALQDYQLSLQNLPESLPNLQDYDLDTGYRAELGHYKLADHAFARLLVKLSDDNFETASATLRADGLQYFTNLSPPPDFRLEKKRYRKTRASLQMLQQTK
ncbi:zinc dependent phospholipase C family protein [Adhaeribacter sp. BT258]|uniref:Zinc dependent phospholipase C family protein n=1 Tax=Adhaeribacter terrigena TaxID=2793070 RepID=A0ABS1C4P3_9BACT|nr:zinc dependent phospholipase C family protein [Adhaeribacter terrigena]MBK0404342.1 zinc dependent phospholipase C family protein [Adhaeribacter terrigena]